MKIGFKRVPAIDKCLSILDLLAKSKGPLGISDISKALNYNRSTVFNIVYTLVDLGILEKRDQKKFHFGIKLHVLSRAAIRRSELINTVHPYLEEINRKTRLMVFLGIRSDSRAVILDKVDSTFDIKVMSEVGMRIPLLAGAGGKALLSQLSDAEVERILSNGKLKKFTRSSCIHKQEYKAQIQKTREEGIAFDMEEYIEGIRGFAVPLNLNRRGLVAAIWVVGLKDQIKEEVIASYSKYLKGIARKIEARFALIREDSTDK
jgi:IclR family KDG regulon transcriptional repressor